MSDNHVIYFGGNTAGLAISLQPGYVFYASTNALEAIDRRYFPTIPDLRSAVRGAWNTQHPRTVAR